MLPQRPGFRVSFPVLAGEGRSDEAGPVCGNRLAVPRRVVLWELGWLLGPGSELLGLRKVVATLGEPRGRPRFLAVGGSLSLSLFFFLFLFLL